MGPGPPAGAPARHDSHRPNTVRWPTSVWKPWLRSRADTRGRDRFRGDLGDPPALGADQVHVLGLGGQVVPGRAVPEVGVGHQAELFEQFQRAVDGGNVHAAGGLLHVGPDFLGRGVLQLGDRREDQLALWRDAVATGPQSLVPRLRHGPRVARARAPRDHGGRGRARDNPLARAGRADVTSGLRGKGGGPTACIAVGLARWLSASRRPAGRAGGACPMAPALSTIFGRRGPAQWLVRVPYGGGRRIHGRHRAPGLTGLVQPVPVAQPRIPRNVSAKAPPEALAGRAGMRVPSTGAARGLPFSGIRRRPALPGLSPRLLPM